MLNRNVKIIFVAGLLSAFILGIFDLLFPFYLRYRGISLVEMGLIFTISTIAIAFLRIMLGEYADVYGRRNVYLSSCILGTAAKMLFPFSIGKFQILLNKFLNDLQDNLRLSVHNIMLFENDKENYAKFFSWFTAANFIFQAAGTACFAILFAYLGYLNLFFLLSGIEAAKLLLMLLYRDKDGKEEKRQPSLKEAYSFKINRRLKILALSSAIGAFGFGIAHGFLLPLYFSEKYGLDAAQISAITAIHRLCFLTTPLAGNIIKRLGLRRTYVISTFAYAFSFLTVGLVTFPILIFLPIFLIHDLIGGGIRMTALSVIVQNSTMEETRGREINTFNAVQIPLTILAPGIAGTLASISWDLIFVAGGLLYIISLMIFCFFFKDETPENLQKKKEM